MTNELLKSPGGDFEIILNNSRSFGGFEEITAEKDLEAWQAITQHYSSSLVKDGLTSSFEISIDWSSRLRYEERYYELYRQPTAHVARSIDAFAFERIFICPAEVVAKHSSEIRNYSGESELHRLLIEIYLVANLSCPGAFNLYRSYIRNKKLDPMKSPLAQTELELSEYVFETAWHEGKKHKWLGVDFLPFDTVLSWYNSLEIREKNLATNDLERAIFSLLHLGRTSFLEPTSVLWLASALESLFDTPSGNSFSYLCKRIAALHELGATETNELKRKLREFFDVRNAFAHGGSSVLHPLADDRESEVQSEQSELLSVTNFASAVLLGSIQELIRRGWKGMKFEEQLVRI